MSERLTHDGGEAVAVLTNVLASPPAWQPEALERAFARFRDASINQIVSHRILGRFFSERARFMVCASMMAMHHRRDRGNTRSGATSRACRMSRPRAASQAGGASRH